MDTGEKWSGNVGKEKKQEVNDIKIRKSRKDEQ